MLMQGDLHVGKKTPLHLTLLPYQSGKQVALRKGAGQDPDRIGDAEVYEGYCRHGKRDSCTVFVGHDFLWNRCKKPLLPEMNEHQRNRCFVRIHDASKNLVSMCACVCVYVFLLLNGIHLLSVVG